MTCSKVVRHPHHEQRVPHISPGFAEMWELTAVRGKRLSQGAKLMQRTWHPVNP